MQSTTMLVFCSSALEHYYFMKHVHADARQVCKNESYILGVFNGEHQAHQVIVREPLRRAHNTESATRQALACFQPQFAVYIGLAKGIKGVDAGDVLVSEGVWINNEQEDASEARPKQLNGLNGVEWKQFAGALADMESRLNAADQDQPFSIHEGAMLSEPSIGAYIAGKPQAQTPGAAGFFGALHSTPEVKGIGLIGIDGQIDETNIQTEDARRAAENLALTVVEFWRLMNLS